MRIYGKTLTEIFGLLPWAYKAVVILGASFFIFAVPYSLHYFITMGIQIDKVEPLIFPGLSRSLNKGVLDPAMATDGKTVLMVHTLLNIDNTAGEPQQMSAEVAVESSTPPCRAWAYVPAGFPARKDETFGPDGVTPLPDGVWRAETPGIVYDADDIGKQWKLFAYRYYWTGSEQLARLYGVIVTKTAPDIYGPWSDEKWLFSAANGQPPAPYDDMGQTHLNDMSPDLKDIWFYSRPSLIYTHKILFMTLSAFNHTDKTPERIVMLKSFDHGKTWQYAGSPLVKDDLAKMGDFTKLGGATLVEYKDKLYLMAVLGNKTADGLGTFVLTFDNPIQGLLARNDKGAPVIAIHHPRNSAQPSKIGGGFTAYNDACKQGMLTSEYSDLRASFQIFKTLKKPLGDE